MRPLAIALAVLSAASCRTSVPGTLPTALMSTAVGIGVAGARRADGDCYTPCVPGTLCNPKTGTCDPLPCRGQCAESERCDESAALPRCVPARDPGLSLTHPTAEAPFKETDLPRSEPER